MPENTTPEGEKKKKTQFTEAKAELYKIERILWRGRRIIREVKKGSEST